MRLLLITDTHGELSGINGLAARVRADAVLHAGDLGFYDDASAERLARRQLLLRVLHSSLPHAVRRQAFALSRQQLVELVKSQAPLSELPAYLNGTQRFDVPVYAVWGNHEDVEVVKAFREGIYRVPNLFLLDETACYDVGCFVVFGLGGNLLPGRKMFQRPLAGGGGRVWTTLSQYARLWHRVNGGQEAGRVRVFVSHVSPGKEAVLRRIAAHLMADIVVSGHMGSPYCLAWNEFAIRTVEETVSWLRAPVAQLEALWAEEREHGQWEADEAEMVEFGLSLLSTLPAGTRKVGRGKAEPLWYRGQLLINLPDASGGHAVLAEAGGQVSLETFSLGIKFGQEAQETSRDED